MKLEVLKLNMDGNWATINAAVYHADVESTLADLQKIASVVGHMSVRRLLIQLEPTQTR